MKVYVSLLLCLFSLAQGCKPKQNRSFLKDVPAGTWTYPQKLTTGPETTFVFTWTDKDVDLQPDSFIDTITEGAQRTKGDPAAQTAAAAGPGIYVATDPFVSKSYGKKLVVIAIKPHSTVEVFIDDHSVDSKTAGQQISSNAAALLYGFGGFTRRPDGFSFIYAAVLRSREIIDTTKSFAVLPTAEACAGGVLPQPYIPGADPYLYLKSATSWRCSQNADVFERVAMLAGIRDDATVDEENFAAALGSDSNPLPVKLSDAQTLAVPDCQKLTDPKDCGDVASNLAFWHLLSVADLEKNPLTFTDVRQILSFWNFLPTTFQETDPAKIISTAASNYCADKNHNCLNPFAPLDYRPLVKELAKSGMLRWSLLTP